MADDPTKTQTDETHEDDERDAPSSTNPNGNQRDADDDADDDSLGEAGKKVLAQARSEARDALREKKRLEREVQELRAKEQQRADAEKTDLEKAVARAEAAEKTTEALRNQLQQEAIRNAVEIAARDLGFQKPALVHKLIDVSGVEFDEETGRPKDVEDLVKQLAKEEPYLVAAKTNGATGGPPATPKSDRPTGVFSPDEDRAHLAAQAAHEKRSF